MTLENEIFKSVISDMSFLHNELLAIAERRFVMYNMQSEDRKQEGGFKRNQKLVKISCQCLSYFLCEKRIVCMIPRYFN